MKTTANETTFQTVLREFADAFTRITRNDGSKPYVINDGSWLTSDMMHDVHAAVDGSDPRLPDDWIYEHTRCVAFAFVDHGCDSATAAQDVTHEVADGLVDTYNAARSTWLAMHLNNAHLCDEAIEELGLPESADMFERIGAGQYLALQRIEAAVIEIVEHEAERRDEAVEAATDAEGGAK